MPTTAKRSAGARPTCASNWVSCVARASNPPPGGLGVEATGGFMESLIAVTGRASASKRERAFATAMIEAEFAPE